MSGGIFHIGKSFSKVNNKHMKCYDNKKPSKYIMYLDENKLYGWEMSQYLPLYNSQFKWLNQN